MLKEAQDAAVLGSKLTDQLLTFARRRHMDTQVIQLNDQVVGITDMLRRTLGEHIMLSTVACPRRLADPGRSGPVPERHRQHGGQCARCHAPRRQARCRDPQHRARRTITPTSMPSSRPASTCNCRSPTPVRACRPRFAIVCSSRSSRPRRRAAAPGLAWRWSMVSSSNPAAISPSIASSGTAPRSISISPALME